MLVALGNSLRSYTGCLVRGTGTGRPCLLSSFTSAIGGDGDDFAAIFGDAAATLAFTFGDVGVGAATSAFGDAGEGAAVFVAALLPPLFLLPLDAIRR
jgi:hypothetical protein